VNHEELQARALTEPPVYWKNSRCIRVIDFGDKIFFLTWAGGFTYNVSREQWDSGQLTEVH
jgi:hypothetical protein